MSAGLVFAIPRKPLAQQMFLPAGFRVEERNHGRCRQGRGPTQPEQSPTESGQDRTGVERVSDLRVDPVLNQSGMIGRFRKRGEISAKNLFPGACNECGDDKNQCPGASPNHRACPGMPEREHNHACEEKTLSSHPAAPTLKNAFHRTWQSKKDLASSPSRMETNRQTQRAGAAGLVLSVLPGALISRFQRGRAIIARSAIFLPGRPSGGGSRISRSIPVWMRPIGFPMP